MSSDIQPYILDELDTVIDQTVADIGLYTKNPGDFTRNRKLNATTTIKVTLNMQGNSLGRMKLGIPKIRFNRKNKNHE